jgi:hypothetical protein
MNKKNFKILTANRLASNDSLLYMLVRSRPKTRSRGSYSSLGSVTEAILVLTLFFLDRYAKKKNRLGVFGN